MRLIVSFAAAIVLMVLLLAACNSNDGKVAGKGNTRASASRDATVEPTPSDGIPRITVTDLKAAVDKGEVLVVDVRSPESYALEHIQGSINIPENTIVARAGELPHDKAIVTYCS
jgi:3-mercaptopyruvate sulfurtransferase SseA